MKIALFSGCAMLIHCAGLCVTTAYLNDVRLKNEETESNIWVIGENKEYDLLLLGSSHGRVFSRHGNHSRVERIIDGKMINLSQGNAGGFSPMLVYLSFFRKKQNQAHHIILLLDPWMFYREGSNNSIVYYRSDYFSLSNFANIVRYGHLSFSNLLQLLVFNNRNNLTQTLQALIYSESSFKESWYNDKCSDIVDDSQFVKMARYQKDRYTKGLDAGVFEENGKILHELFEYCSINDLKLTVIIPPTLTPEPGHENACSFVKEQQKKYHFQFYDFAKEVPDKKYFYDLDHMNTDGVTLFADQYLRPIVSKTRELLGLMGNR